ncbi:DUF4199 domain-containing protein [Dyadobacter luticola]|uniref:DUF4199 domain-containing protein n=1 Tax=Dyadobacter luticola TaxID=1979387 RepID=A0A5R9L4C0_9BACT|nr:DUF4199 domain-containing protein [Dyadobacter luticola]TLV03251.1 DUF4199 domain-containing protein [Dyadobacter luticola]
MKKVILTCGLIAGTIVSAFMLFSMNFLHDKMDSNSGMIVGYASMLLSFSLIFVGVKNFRDKYNQGRIKFGQALMIGLGISLIASTMYVIAWGIDFHFFMPDFMDKFCAAQIKSLQAKGVTGAELQSQIDEMNGYKEMYKNPVSFALLTYMEILPVGLIVSLICALILKRQGTRDESWREPQVRADY